MPGPFPHRMVMARPHVRHDPHLGHAFLANVDRRIPHERGSYVCATNDLGYRDCPFDEDRSRPRILCVGDSFAAGDGVDNHERFSDLLEGRLDASILNVAVPGYGPDQNALQFESGGLPQADLILWCIAVHTIDRIQTRRWVTIDREGRLWEHDRPSFELLDDGELKLRGVPVPREGRLLGEGTPPRLPSATIARSQLALGWARSKVASWIKEVAPPRPDRAYDDPHNPGWRLMAALVRRVHAQTGDTPVVVVPLPTGAYLSSRSVDHFVRRFGELEDVARGLHTIDVLTELRSRPRHARRRFHYASDGHLTSAGHGAVADALESALVARGLARRTETPDAATTSRSSRARTLTVGWSLDQGYARIDDGDVSREPELTGGPIRSGLLPLSAIHDALDLGEVRDGDLQRVILVSPIDVAKLSEIDRDNPGFLAYAAGWVRWQGAVVRDLFAFLGTSVEVEHRCDFSLTALDSDRGVDTDDEATWMRRHLAPLRRVNDERELERRLRRLAWKWELVTRTERQSALPTMAPLRRGRAVSGSGS